MSVPAPAPHTVDLDAYFKRIGYEGSRDVSLATLNGIVLRHACSIPFENLDVLLGERIFVDAASIEAKLVGALRGGYCFEQNTLLRYVLVALGFEVTPISARVRYQKPRDPTPSRSHLCLVVRIDGADWLADVGIGSLSLTSAIRVVRDESQETPHDRRRLVCEGAWTGLSQRAPDAVIIHQAIFGNDWEDVAEFTLEAMHPIDVEVANWYTNMHPQSHFKDRLTVALATDEGRMTLVNREFKVRTSEGRVESRTLATDEELFRTMEETFGLRIPPLTRFVDPTPGGQAQLWAGHRSNSESSH